MFSPLHLHAGISLSVFGWLYQMPPRWQNYSSTPSIFIWGHPRSFTSLTVFLCEHLQPKDIHVRNALLVIWLNVCVSMLLCICGVCLCVWERKKNLIAPSNIRHILKVTNQARWPIGKIKDTFLKKRNLWFIISRRYPFCSSKGLGSRGFQQTPRSFHTKFTVTHKPFCVTHQNDGGESKGDLRRKREWEGGGREDERGWV